MKLDPIVLRIIPILGPLLSIAASAATAMRSLPAEPAADNSIHPGVVLRVSRRFYWHYGLYVGGGQIVHYTNDDADMSSKNIIQKTSLDEFLADAPCLDLIGVPEAIEGRPLPSLKESIRRAEANIGRSSYDLLRDNCQHFAIWCRTGIPHSGQSHFSGPSDYKVPTANYLSKEFSKGEVSEYFVKALLALYKSDKEALMPDWLGHGYCVSRLKASDYKAY